MVLHPSRCLLRHIMQLLCHVLVIAERSLSLVVISVIYYCGKSLVDGFDYSGAGNIHFFCLILRVPPLLVATSINFIP